MRRIGEDALPWMKSIGAGRRKRFVRLTARAGLGFGAFYRKKRKIVDRSGPGELRIFEGRSMASRSGKFWKRHQHKNEVPQCRRDHRANRNFSFNPAVLEKTSRQKVLRDFRPAEECGDATSHALMKASPGEIQLRFMAASQAHGSGRLGSLSQEVQCPADLAHRHFPFFQNKPRAAVLAR
jgi:hypothetical protein